MVIANLAQYILALSEYQVTQALFVQERAALRFRQAKMSAFTIGNDVFCQPFSDFAACIPEAHKALFIDINFPADAAAVAAGPHDAGEISVIIGYKLLHAAVSKPRYS